MITKPSRRDDYRLKLMARLCKDSQEVLDVGLYYPNFYLAKYNQDIKITGLDNIKVDLPKGYKSVEYGDLQKLDQVFPQNTFDAILMGEVIEHIKNPYLAIEQCWKALKPGGKLILSTPNPLGFPRLFFELFNFKKYFYHRNHYFMFVPRWMNRILENSGFVKPKMIGLAFIIPVKTLIFLADQVIYIAVKPDKTYRKSK